MAIPNIEIDPDVPLTVIVDLQSRHITAFRLLRRDDEGEEWRFLKSGHKDSSTIVPDMPTGGELRAEFVYTPDPDREFRALLAFEQKGELLDDGAIPVTEGGDKMFTFQEVTFS